MTKTHYMCAHRMRNFLRQLIIRMKENPEDWKKIIDNAIKCALKLWGIKKLLDVTWNELVLACFWITMLQNKIMKYKLTYLIDLARDVLGKRIRSGRIMKITTFLRRTLEMYDVKSEAKELIEMIVKHLNQKNVLMSRGASKEYVDMLREIATEIVDKIAKKVSMSPRMLAACALWIADKKVSKRLKLGPFLTARDISDVTGLSIYSILRKTTLLMFDYIKNIDSDAHEK